MRWNMMEKAWEKTGGIGLEAGIYDVRQYGALGDGAAKDTEAIQRAIDICHREGGGIVRLFSGTYLSGGLYLKSGVYLEIGPLAVLKASGDISDYGKDTHHNRYRNEKALDQCFLFAEDAENIGIFGNGIIDGNAGSFPNEGSLARPMLIRFLRCRQVRLENICLKDAASWTTAFLDSAFIWVRGVLIENSRLYNGDGLDFDGCSHVFVSDCRIRGTDDNLCLQSSGKEYPMEDIHITGCEFTSVCAGVRIGLKSVGDIRNVVISGCTFHDVWREGIKIECTEGGSISNILIQGMVMRNVTRPVWMILNNRFEPDGLGSSLELSEMPAIGVMEHIMVSDLIITDSDEMRKEHLRFGNDVMGSPRFGGIRLDAESSHPIRDVMMSHVLYTAVGGVKKHEIPENYPSVIDRLKDRVSVSSENYYPDWSRAVFLDCRNVDGLVLDHWVLRRLYADERDGVIIENCQVIKKEIKEWQPHRKNEKI